MWKDYEDLENSLSMPELTEILVAKRKNDHEHRRFLAAIQGVDIGDGPNEKPKDAPKSFDDIKAKVFSRGQAADANDILALQGITAQQKGFGIGMGIDYTDAKDMENPKW